VIKYEFTGGSVLRNDSTASPFTSQESIGEVQAKTAEATTGPRRISVPTAEMREDAALHDQALREGQVAFQVASHLEKARRSLDARVETGTLLTELPGDPVRLEREVLAGRWCRSPEWYLDYFVLFLSSHVMAVESQVPQGDGHYLAILSTSLDQAAADQMTKMESLGEEPWVVGPFASAYMSLKEAIGA